jgi:hypothetical protein
MGCESPAPAPTYLIKCCTGAGEPWANNKGVVYMCAARTFYVTSLPLANESSLLKRWDLRPEAWSGIQLCDNNPDSWHILITYEKYPTSDCPCIRVAYVWHILT